MFSSTIIKGTAQNSRIYFERDDGYYTKDSSPSEWFGSGAEQMNLSGQVDADKFEQLLEGITDAGEQIGKRAKDENGNSIVKHAPGWDLTFSAPKSVSVMAYTGDDRIVAAHKAAVDRVLATVEKEHVLTRIRTHGAMNVRNPGNMIAAKFEHATSRANDPQMHTHAVVMNMTFAEGKWRSVYSQSIYDAKMQMGAIYHAELAKEIQKLGYDISPSTNEKANGVFEIVGVPVSVIGHFSKRSKEIEKALDDIGLSRENSTEKQRVSIAKSTRSAKDTSVQLSDLKGKWTQEAKELGFEPEQLTSTALARSADKRHAQSLVSSAEKTIREAVETAIQDVSERNEVWTKQQIIESVVNLDFTGISPLDVSKHLDQKLGGASFPSQKTAVYSKAHKRMIEVAGFSTHEAVSTAHSIKETVMSGMNAFESQASSDRAKELITEIERKTVAAGHSLTTDHKNALHSLMTNKDRISIIDGRPGTAKSNAVLKNYADFLRAEGHEVIAVAPTARAMGELRKAGVAEKPLSVKGAINMLDRERKEKVRELRAMPTAGVSPDMLPKHIREGMNNYHVQKALGHYRAMDQTANQSRFARNTVKTGFFDQARTTQDPINRLVKDLAASAYQAVHLVQGKYHEYKSGVSVKEIQKHLKKAEKDGWKRQANDTNYSYHARMAKNHLKKVDSVSLSRGSMGAWVPGAGYMVKGLDGTYKNDPIQGYLVLAANMMSKFYNSMKADYHAIRAEQAFKKQGDVINRDTDSPNVPLGKQKVIILDESSFLASSDTKKLLDAAKKVGARIVFSGDREQHASVGAGAAHRQMMKNGANTVEINQIVRQKNEFTRKGVEMLRQNNVEGAMVNMENGGGSVNEIANGSDRREMMANKYVEKVLSEAGEAHKKDSAQSSLNNLNKGFDSVLAVEPTKAGRAETNSLIRSKLDSEGVLKGAEVNIKALQDKQHTNAVMGRANSYEKGEVVQIRNEMGRGKGTIAQGYFEVKDVNLKKNTITIADKNGKEREIKPKEYASRMSHFEKTELPVREGDRLKFTQNNSKGDAQRINGDKLVVSSVNEKTGAITAVDTKGQEHQLQKDSLKDSHVRYAYADTSVSTQGATAKAALVNMDSKSVHTSTMATTFVGASRAEYEIHMFTDSREKLIENVQQRSGQQQGVQDGHHPDMKQDKEFKPLRPAEKVYSDDKPVERQLEKAEASNNVTAEQSSDHSNLEKGREQIAKENSKPAAMSKSQKSEVAVGKQQAKSANKVSETIKNRMKEDQHKGRTNALPKQNGLTKPNIGQKAQTQIKQQQRKVRVIAERSFSR